MGDELVIVDLVGRDDGADVSDDRELLIVSLRVFELTLTRHLVETGAPNPYNIRFWDGQVAQTYFGCFAEEGVYGREWVSC